jgi:LPXTG-motif cell wall-anchored protein
MAAQTLAAVAEEVRDPSASIGDVNCTSMTVPVTLDNTRSTVAVAYQYEAGEDEVEVEAGVVMVPAGAVRIVNVRVTEDSQISISVFVDFELTFALLTVDCTDNEVPYDPRASIGGVDCAQMTVDVTLDNSRSEVQAIYHVTREVGLGVQEDEVIVPPGVVQTLPIPVAEHIDVFVGVAEGVHDRVLATEMFFLVDCTPGDNPLASIGEVNCTDLTVPVTLDNTRSSVEMSFFIMAAESSGLLSVEPYQDVFTVDGGAERVVRVPLPNNAEVNLFVDQEFSNVFLANETFEVECPNTAARPTVAVQGTKLPQTGGFNLALPLLGVALLTGGGGMVALTGRRHRH